METWIGYLGVALLGIGSATVFSRLVQTIRKESIDRIHTESYRISDAIFIGLIIVSLGALYVLSALLAVGNRPEMTIDAVLTGCLLNCGIIGIILLFLTLRGVNPLRLFGLGNLSPKSLGIGLGLLICAYPLIILAQLISYAFTAPEARAQEIVTFLLESQKWSERIAVSVLAVIMAPITEELIFRGYLYGVIRKYGGRVWAIGLTSLLFAAIHVHLPAMLALFILAVVLCLAYEWTGSLWVPISMHATFNAASVYLAVFHPSLAQ